MVQRPPSLKRFLHFPVTGGIALLAVVLSCTWWYTKVDVSPLQMDYWIWHGQPWRLISATLLHANPFHLFFDVYWLLVFGAIVEEAFGSLFLLGFAIVLAIGSMAAEWALGAGGVGLSGVGYGLFGFLWVLSRFTRRFEGVIDKTTAWVFVIWFFVCIYTTVTNILPVANVAHGVGALLGGLAGCMVAFRGRKRYAAGAGLGAILALAIVGSSPILRPVINFSKDAGNSEFLLGFDSLKANHYEQAVNYLRQAVAYRRPNPDAWYDLGVAYDRQGLDGQALAAFRRALAMVPDSQIYQNAVQSMAKR